MPRPTPARVLATLTAIGLLVLVAGCGSDGDPAAAPAERTTSTSTTAATPSTPEAATAFCDAYLAMATGLNVPSDDVDPGALTAAVADTAPPDVRDQVDALLSAADAAGASGDDRAFLADAFRDPSDRVSEYVASTCGFQVVEVTAEEYSFRDVPARLEPGPTVFHFTNDGREIHEGYLFRRADGRADPAADLLAADPSNDNGTLVEQGVAFIGETGDEGYLTVDLEPGQHLLACFFPQGVTTIDAVDASNDGDAAHDHRSAGMVASFEVG